MTASLACWTKNVLHVLVLLTFLAHVPLQTAAQDIATHQGLPAERYLDCVCYRSNRTITVQCHNTMSDKEIETFFENRLSAGSPSRKRRAAYDKDIETSFESLSLSRKRRAAYDYVRDESNLLSEESTSALESRTKRGSYYRRSRCDCPEVVDQTAPFDFSPDSAAYPAQAIADALRSDVGQCIALEFDLATSPPVVDDTDLDARTKSFSCSFSELRLWSYRSERFANGDERCWVVQNFGDLILYKTCLTDTCKDCSNLFWHNTQDCWKNQCVAEVKPVTFWAFCPSLGLVRDKILVPTACNCRKLRCNYTAGTSSGWWYRGKK